MKRLSLFLLAVSAFAADVQRLILNPLPTYILNTADGANIFTIDATGEQVYTVAQAPAADTITSLCFGYGTRTGTPVQHKISIQTVDGSTGFASGTISASAAFTPPADTTWNQTIQCVAISHDGAGGALSSIALTRGQVFALLIENCQNATAPCSGSTTPSGANSSAFYTGFTIQGGRPGLPYSVTAPDGTDAKNAQLPNWGIRSATRTYGQLWQAVTGTAISSGDEQGIRFTIPSTVCSTFKLAGVRALVTAGAAAKNVRVASYSGTTVLDSVTYDTDNTGGTDAGRRLEVYFQDSTLDTLSCGTQYRVGFSPQDATTNFILRRMTLAAAGDRTQFPGGTIVGGYTTRTGCDAPCDGTATAWTDTDTAWPFVELILDDITPPSGSGGGSFTFVQ